MLYRNLFTFTAFWAGCSAFTVQEQASRRVTSLNLSEDNLITEGSRRSFLSQAAITTGMACFGETLSLQPANAVSGVSKVDAKLRGYGLPPLGPVPDGFAPLLEIYGKGKNRFPILVSFSHPITWVVQTPSNDVNGEDGTVQAGDYGKGDTATFFVYSDPGHVNDIASQPKELFEKALMKSIGQKGENMYQNFKVTKLTPVTKAGQTYVMADFKYQLLTGAGFEVDRKGVASITSEGPAVEVLWAASTSARFKKTEPNLRNIVDSFRCYTEGINMSDELMQYD
jgi:hypothetical protein